MSNRPSRLRLNSPDADRLITAIHSQSPVAGLTHEFYKYPARFSPDFAGTAIETFTDPGDLVADPFVGGGTTLVEARARGRLAIGTDVSTLATFVSKTKTQSLSGADITYLQEWLAALPERINLHQDSSAREWTEMGYDRNLHCRTTWPIRKAIELALATVRSIRHVRRQNFARCVVLRTSQWALDGRKAFPSVEEFRRRLLMNGAAMLKAAVEYTRTVRRADRETYSGGRKRTICLTSKAEGLAQYLGRAGREGPKLIVTSPPYPGVHILYHRWQVRGGKETPAPFWIADRLDGAGEAYYTMYARRDGLRRYSRALHLAFTSLQKVVGQNTTVIQLVAFADPGKHLSFYLRAMNQAGFKEHVLRDHVDSRDGRIWRDVPSRKWYAEKKGNLPSAKEVMLIHKPY